MARVKPKRQSPNMDLTAMSDMAWLLLTFFILTSNFREPEVVEVVTPSSVSTLKMADDNMMRISITKEGKYLFSLEEKDRIPTLEKMGEKYGVRFTDGEKKAFRETAEFGAPMQGMRQFLNLTSGDREKYLQSSQAGIPLDTINPNKEMVDWVFAAKEVNDKVNLAIKGDQEATYPQFKLLLNELQEKNMNKFQLITTAE
ncbi:MULTISPECIES: ExbD/TolR family protein [Weeksella]|uniref:Biopolymer transport protein ExbD/TolR n=1 Tax=Weeksella virosa (strain ATCC 43766 / DSM 16922 / JCM 21250 / CCUG 30538 / CDC 9751 / IAM 14551 / NBRC 16016 / NCTC 11634 / CL345/78) TaxID=865938 RepID=F0NY41_WEEVC|nr:MULTISPECIES: biopolymer transporter ExbD [Weeksella]ADX67032.1 Biopolymer transport protein ExbD/TolR [Weeksella virosa DSM 16922]MDK7375575.1 biopolymer transporter ExbD [Weeksella virosa]MDK7674961.1 biopolymer transporter ExbD [Weeksella virosa]OFM84220.1 biopolymer transporter ExbD [Weeksella sp. HMSC059D05]SUP53298.1 protein TolR [Weeksella virosa]